jgi:DNA-directed RNA polymerase subunit L
LQQAAALVDVYEELEDTDSALYVLPEEVEEVRSRGFVFANYLERKIQVLSDQWTAAREQVVAAVERRSNELAHEIDETERVLQAAYSGSRPAVARAENSIRQLESKVTAAQDAIESMFDTVDENVTQVMYQLERINWTLDQAAEASFDFYEGEDVVAACRAQLVEDGEEGPKGILHITDDRLVFEQKEEIATKKILFITTEKELVQEMLLETPIGQVEEMKASQSGFLGRKDMLEIHFAPGSRYTELHLHLLSMDNKDCIQLINRVRTGEIDRERVQVEGEGEAEQEAVAMQVEEIPTKCPNCGASFTTPIVRGMRELTCDYCGTVVRL